MRLPNKHLKTWFVIHFVADMLFGFPLLFFPEWTLGLFEIMNVEQVTARLVGAALIGIGGVSLLAREKGKESYKSLLTLKVIWSFAAIVALSLSLLNSAPKSVWFILGIFIVFNIIWVRYFISIDSK